MEYPVRIIEGKLTFVLVYTAAMHEQHLVYIKKESPLRASKLVCADVSCCPDMRRPIRSIFPVLPVNGVAQ